MARQAAILSEDDGGGSSDLSELEALAPPPANRGDQGAQRQQARTEEPEFEIIETDENLQPLQQPQDNGQGNVADQALSEDQEGDGTYVGRQNAQQQQQTVSRSKQKRKKHQEARDNAWREIDALRRENEELRQRFSSIEPRINQMTEGQARGEISQVERQIAENRAFFERSEDRIADALSNNDPATLKIAMRERDQAVIDGQQLLIRKNFLSNNLNTMTQKFQQQPAARQELSQQSSGPAPLPMAVQRHIQDFSENHDWYDPSGRDRDSKIVLMLDNEVADDGFDMGSPEYWQELEDRMREVLPHRFADQQQAPARQPQNGQRQVQQQTPTERRGPMTSGSGDRGPAPKSNQVYMNASRRQAMINAGVLAADGQTVTDKVKFDRLLKSYQKYDRENGAVR